MQHIYRFQLFNKRGRVAGQRGVAMCDLIIAITVVAFGAVAALSLMTQTSQACKQNEYYLIAEQIGRVEMDTIRAGKGYKLSNRINAPLISTPVDLNKLPKGTAKLTVSDSSLVSGGKDITVNVSWKPVNVPTQTVNLTTMISPNGPNP